MSQIPSLMRLNAVLYQRLAANHFPICILVSATRYSLVPQTSAELSGGLVSWLGGVARR